MPPTIADTRERLPAGPRAPATVQLLRWALDPLPFLDHCARTYGSWFTVRFPGYPPIVMISDPEIVREVFGGDPLELDSGSPNRMLRPLLGSGSVILLDGREHRQRRKLLMPAFHGRQVAAYGEEMRRQADRSSRRCSAWRSRGPRRSCPRRF